MSGHTDILLRNLGFRGNPFSSLEAGKEEGREWFYACFVEPPGFSTILGDATSPEPLIVFAPRGSGKTALRAMLHYYCRRGYVPGGRVLSIPHVDPSAIEEKSLGSEPPSLARLHVETIVQKGLAALCQQIGEEPRLQEDLRRSLALPERELLQWYVTAYGQELRAADCAMVLSPCMCQEAGQPRNSGGSGGQNPAAQHGGDLVDYRREGSYVALMQGFLNLVLSPRPFTACYILVDGIDELGSTAADWDRAAAIVEPLAANLKLMDLPGVAFRFFLPAELKSSLQARSAIRRDRVLWYDLVWRREGLAELLHKRLVVFSDYHIESLDQICADSLKGGKLENEMLDACEATPRTLLRLGQELLRQQAECLQQGSEHMDWRISEEAWRRARAALALPEKKDLLPIEVSVPSRVGRSNDSAEDKAQLLHRVMTDYPGPIAITCRDYLFQREPLHKLNRLLDLFELSLGFCGVLMMAQYQQQLQDQRQGQGKSLAQAVGASCKRMSLGNWRWVLGRLTGLSGSLGRTPVGSQLHEFIGSDTGGAVESLIELRNHLAHSALQANPGFYAQRLQEADQQLLKVMSGLSFLADLQLIRVSTLQREGGMYLHEAKLYRGDNPYFPWTTLRLSHALDTHRLLVLYRQLELPVYPLLIAAHCPECGQEEVFLYQEVSGDEVIYHSATSGHRLQTTQSRSELRSLLGV